jgi:hypothetical protein
MLEPNIRARLIKLNLAALNQQYEAAKARGESETYLALARFKIDELKAALADAEKRGAA